MLLKCLPGFWQAAGPNKLTLPPNLPSSAAAKLQGTLDGALVISLPAVLMAGMQLIEESQVLITQNNMKFVCAFQP